MEFRGFSGLAAKLFWESIARLSYGEGSDWARWRRVTQNHSWIHLENALTARDRSMLASVMTRMLLQQILLFTNLKCLS